MNFIENRLVSYQKIAQLLQSENQVNKCGLKPFRYTQFGSKSANGIAFKLKTEEGDELVAKVMGYDQNVQRESEYYEMFKEDVIDQSMPHFPLVWENLHCVDQCYFIDPDAISDYLDNYESDKWEEIKENNCFILFAELFDGDLESLCRKGKCMDSLVASMISQVVMALSQMENEGISHDDLHSGNILYAFIERDEEVNTENEMYFKYVMKNGDVFYIRHYNTLFSLWDFGNVKEIGSVSSRNNVMWLKKRNLLIGKSDDILKSIARFFDSSTPQERKIIKSTPYWDMTILMDDVKRMTKTEFTKKIKEFFFEHTKKSLKKLNKNPDWFKTHNAMKDVLVELSGMEEFFQTLLYNKNVSEEKVTATFYPEGKE